MDPVGLVDSIARYFAPRQGMAHDQTTRFAGLLDAFAEGFTAVVAADPDRFCPAVRRHLPIVAADLLTAHRVLTMKFLINPIIESRTAGHPTGSNAWAIGPSLSCTSRSLLLGHPICLGLMPAAGSKRTWSGRDCRFTGRR